MMSRYLYPRAGDAPQSILLGASRRGLGFAVGCGLVFCVAFSCFARAVVSFVPLTSSRSALVLCVRPWSRAGVSFFFPSFGAFVSYVAVVSCVLNFGPLWWWCWSSRAALVFASSVAVVSCVLNFGPRLVLVLVVPRGVGLSISHFP